MKITIIVPIYNESKTIEQIVFKINQQKKINKQIILIDDCSTDGTSKIIKEKLLKKVDLVKYKKKNAGKSAAIKSAVPKIKGDVVIIQDADLEYDPKDYAKLLRPIKLGLAKVVYGSRVLNKNRYKEPNFTSNFRVFANHFLTVFSNILYSQNLTDAHTCYKVIATNIFKKLNIREKRFGFCPEVTAQLSKKNINIVEVPISYRGRTFDDGKKISLKDAIRAIYVLIKYKFI